MDNHVYVANYSLYTDEDDKDPRSREEISVPQVLTVSRTWTKEWLDAIKAHIEADLRYMLDDDFPQEPKWVSGEWENPHRTSMTMYLEDPGQPGIGTAYAVVTFRIMYDGELPRQTDQDPSL